MNFFSAFLLFFVVFSTFSGEIRKYKIKMIQKTSFQRLGIYTQKLVHTQKLVNSLRGLAQLGQNISLLPDVLALRMLIFIFLITNTYFLPYFSYFYQILRQKRAKHVQMWKKTNLTSKAGVKHRFNMVEIYNKGGHFYLLL